MHTPHHSPEIPLLELLPDEAATLAFGRKIAPLLRQGMVVWLEGDLGAGKTSFARAVLRGLGHEGPVKSPTYALVEVYVVSSIYLYHFDFYRFNTPEEFDDAGLAEYFREDALCLVEWPQKAAGFVPDADIVLSFRFPEEGAGRVLSLLARSEAGQQCLSALSNSQAAAVG